MIEYVNALEAARSFPFFSRNGVRAFVRLNAEAHMRSQLSRIRKAYVRLEQSFPESTDVAKQRAKWLEENEARLDRFTDTLSSWRKIFGSLGAVATPLIATVVTVLTKVDLRGILKPINLTGVFDFGLVDGAMVAAVFAGALGYFVAFVLLSFRGKRHLFHSGARNVYQREDDLFKFLPEQKRYELPIDHIIVIASSAFFSVVCIWVIQRSIDWDEPLITAMYAVYLVLALYSGIKAMLGFRRRTWR